MKMKAVFLISIITCLIFAVSTFLAAGEPGAEKEIVGSHVGAKNKSKPPHNMVSVTGGKVWIGMSSDEVLKISQKNLDIMNNLSHSIPKHQVRVGSFYCDIYEVTNAQWKQYLDSTGQEPSEDLVKFAWKKATTFPENEANFPIRNVSHRDARKFARWCGKRLPTEYEWTRAAAGDKDLIYPWGNDWIEKLCTNRFKRLSPVGSYEEGKSSFGIYDMSGSVWEWTDSHFDAFKGFKPPRIKIGKKWKAATTRFSGSSYVMKGGDYQGSFLACRLDIRDGWLPNTNTTTLGFRCVKDEQPGQTMLTYAQQDLEGSMLTDKDFDMRNLYTIESTEYTNDDTRLIKNFDYMLACPLAKRLTTTAKIRTDSVDEPFPIGVLSLSRPLEEPNLPPGSYVIAFRNKGLGTKEKEEKLRREAEEKKRKEEEEKKKKEEEEKKKKKGEEKEEEEETPKTQEELEAEARRKAEEEAARKAEEERKKREEAARKELERLGLVSTTKQHIDFPRDKNLILFMNANDTIVGYVEIEDMQEVMGPTPINVSHAPATGLTTVELGVAVLGGKNPRFSFPLKIKDNPF